MNFEVDLAFEGLDGNAGVEYVALMRSMGAGGVRVTEPREIRPALKWATRESDRRRLNLLYWRNVSGARELGTPPKRVWEARAARNAGLPASLVMAHPDRLINQAIWMPSV
jgi:hypothetical protein